MGSPDQYYDVASSRPTSTEPADAIDISVDSEDESIFDRQSFSALRRRNLFVRKTHRKYQHSELEPGRSTQDLLAEDDEVLNASSRVQAREYSRDLPELSEQHLQRINLKAVSIPVTSTLIYPKSQYKGSVPPLPVCKERIAIQELRCVLEERKLPHLMADRNVCDADNFEEFELTNFAIYLPKMSHNSFQLRGLQDLASRNGCFSMLLDGVLRVGPTCRYIQEVPFETCSIGNYGREFHTIGEEVWVQTTFNKKSQLYYRLKAPAPEYQRFHIEFLWLADLAKHFFDYCEACEEEKQVVSVHNFREDFSRWLLESHGESAQFRTWYEMYPGSDFRQAISTNIKFLFKETVGVRDELRVQPVWSELLDYDHIPSQDVKQYHTVVTPYVYDCFGHLRFGRHLKVVAPAAHAHSQQSSQGHSLNLTIANALGRPVVEIPTPGRLKTARVPFALSQNPATNSASADADAKRRRKIRTIRIGDVISVIKDGEGSLWKDETARWKSDDRCWYVYVQAVHKLNSDERSFDGIWLYKPCDTSCAKMRYIYANELFCSNHCTCKKGKMQGRIEDGAVLDVVSVAWHGQPSNSSRDLFIRQTYLDNQIFVTLKDSHKKCEHFQSEEASNGNPAHTYQVGQTVLVAETKLFPPRRKSRYALDPYEIVKLEGFNSKEYAVLRQLLRRNEMEGQSLCRPNELVYTDQTVKVELKKIERTCLVRFYGESDMKKGTIPAPYCRDGTGNAFYITSKLVENQNGGKLSPIGTEHPESLIQGFDPHQEPSRQKLRGLDLFCGGGNFGRGLEEGQAVRNMWAIDMDKVAIHTYHANLRDPEDTHLFFGSVNDQLFQALQGNPENSQFVPQPGEVDFISAGSPCQGFSLLNNSREQEKGLQNQSMVASVAAYIDFYRPKYGLLENVLNMAQTGKERDHDVLSQLICAIVGMGYQLSTFLIDAWSYGSPQSRSRIFVAFTAPGLEPIPHPELSHSHPPNTNDRGLGLQANGLAFGERRYEPTPLNYLTARKAVSDLPFVGEGSTHTCIPYPDHVNCHRISTVSRARIAAIPTFPRGMNFWKSWNNGKSTMTKEQREVFPPSINRRGNASQSVAKNSKAWGRVDPNHLFHTVIAKSTPIDARTGTVIHWDQHRCMTIMEGRRAQSYPDNEVVIGSDLQRWKVIGNSVDRSVALALGLALRKAWEKNPLDSDSSAATPDNTIHDFAANQILRSIPSNQALAPKRSYSLAVPRNAALEQSRKVARLSNASCPSSSSSTRQFRPEPTAKKNVYHAQQARSNPLNASQSNDRLRPNVKQSVPEKESLFCKSEEEADVTCTAAFWSSEGEEHGDEEDNVRMDVDRESLFISSSSHILQGHSLPPSQSRSTQIKHPRSTNASNQENRESPTTSRSKPPIVIDLTSDDELQESETTLRPLPILPVRQTVVFSHSKYVPAGKNPFSPYAETYRAKNLDQLRKHGRKK